MMQATQEIVRVFWENGVPRGIMLKNGHTEFFTVRHATNDSIDQFLNVQTELKKDEQT